MKKFFRAFIIAVACIMSMSALVACNNRQSSSLNEEIVADEGYEGKGTHEATVTELNGYFIQKGLANYTLVLPVDAKDYETEAAQLINQYTYAATGATYPVVTDENLDKGGKYISIGETTLLHESGISIPYSEYGKSGFRMLTRGNVLYLAGARSPLRKGTLFAAQEFLKYTVGYHVYTIDEIKYDSVSSVKAMNFNVVEIPEFDDRRYGVYDITRSNAYVNALRLDVRTEGQLPLTGHSHFTILPPEEYFADHPDWYWYKEEGATEYDSLEDMDLNGQLCLSNQEMIAEFSRRLVEWFLEYPEANFCHLGMMDSPTGCECKNCKAMKDQYNTNLSGLNMMFMNQVARTVTAEIQKTNPERELYFETFAYYTTLEPPATITNGEWKEHCAEVIPDSNIFIQFAPLGYNTSEILTAQQNQQFAEYLEGWGYLVGINGAQISVWNYTTNFNWLHINHKNWDTVTYNLRYYSENGVTYMYDQGYNNWIVGGAFVELRAYVEAALMWNVSLNFQELAEDFIANYYGDAAFYVQEAYDVMTTYYEKLHADGLSGDHKLDIGVNKDERWSFAYVESQRQLYEKAYQSIEHLKFKNNEEYEKYYLRISAAYLENMYMQMEFYMANYSKDYVSETIDLFEKTAATLGINLLQEAAQATTVSTYVTKWRGANV